MEAGRWNCTSYPQLQANPDIGGIGILIAFVATAYMTWLCCIAKKHIDHRRSPGRETPELDRWSSALGAVILSFSDQQIVIGISVIVAGVSQFNSGLDTYHWQTVANLAWFSAFVHVTALAVLRDEDRFNKRMRKLRILAMGTLVIMLCCVSYSLGWTTGVVTTFDGYNSASLPANFPAPCLYRPDIRWGYANSVDEIVVAYNWAYTALNWAILILGFTITVLLQYFDNMSEVFGTLASLLWLDKFSHQIRKLGLPAIQSLESNVEVLSRPSMRYRLCRGTYALKFTAMRMYSSTIWEFTWLFLILLWGTIRIFTVRAMGAANSDPASDSSTEVLAQEDTWAFGQVVSLVLLILSFISFFGK
ncbi:hypothetical protein N431DRAFT_472320 [Stipitochalara longipes BDJ]|nr:hypothetical protein N431DRAFT_472320 [Stipitochalara longipes BDJ]